MFLCFLIFNQLYGLVYNGSTYYYVRDQLLYILGIVDTNGNLMVKYNYNAWGDNVTTIGTLASTVGSENPFRYKGYYFDEELNMYYCHTRYYMPRWCRWLNEDNTNYLESDNINSMNLYQYCNNDPVNYKQRPVSKTILSNSAHLELSHYILSKAVETKTGVYSSRLKNIKKMNKPAVPVINSLYDGQLIQFDYSKNPDYNIFTSIYYAYKLYENGLPAGRTIEGIWFELLGHYIIHKLDIFDLTDRDDVADMGSYVYDNNAYIWENIIHGIMKGLENWYYDKW